MLFSDNLKRLCSEAGTNATTLCKALGWSTSRVSAWNTGTLPKLDDLDLMAAFLGCTVSDFFADPSAQPSAPTLSDDEADLLRIFRSLPRKERHRLLTCAYDLEDAAEMAGDRGSHAAG